MRMQTKTPSFLANLLKICIDHKAHKSGKLIQAHVFRTNQFSDILLLNRLIELYSKCGHILSARNLFDEMRERNIYTYHTMLDPYCKLDDLDNARHMFSQMPKRTNVSWNLMISALSRNGFEREAVEHYYIMRSVGFMPTRYTFASVLSACGSLGNVECGRECHCIAFKLGLEGNMFVGNGLVGMYMKCGFVGDAIQVFNGLAEHSKVSFTLLMQGFLKAGSAEEALDVFRLMHRVGISIDSISLSSVLAVCAKPGVKDFEGNIDNEGTWCNVHGKQIHGLVVKLGFERDLHLNNSLLDMYAKHGNMECAEMLFNSMFEVDVVSWNIMIGGYGQDYNNESALEYMERMESCGFEPNEVTYVNMLTACVRNGDIETGREIFNGMSGPSLSSWNAMLSGYSQNKYHKEVLALFREMQFKDVQPDRSTLAVVLSSCADLELLENGKQVHAASMKIDLYADPFIASGLIVLYSKCGEIEVAKHVFDEVPIFDIVCWNSMISGLSLNSLHHEALTFFKQMLGKGMLPTEFTYATILSSCSSISSLSHGLQIHCMIAKYGCENDVYIGSALIKLYSKCGNVGEARQLFDMMPCKNIITWNEMLHGYAQNGWGDEALMLFRNMIISGTKPDSATFVSVLTACSHSGLVDSGISIFISMQKDYGIQPLMYHYACIIDSLGRAGRLNEIEVLIDKISCRDDPIIWEVLLSSCRVHGNIKLARRAADELFRLVPKNSAPYTLLAGVYSSLGKWDEVQDVRVMMKDRQVSKIPAYSWV